MVKIILKGAEGILPPEEVNKLTDKYLQYASDIENIMLITYKNLKTMNIPNTGETKLIGASLIIVSATSFIQFYQNDIEKYNIYSVVLQTVIKDLYKIDDLYDDNMFYLRTLFANLQLELSLKSQ
ncbi:hypothetical protein BJ944DRAFT_237752 [Cunninghamella echinulata]|nr:hypothetical protein BJ944DRAFT_237752 [Cunninghamella echinulata]